MGARGRRGGGGPVVTRSRGPSAPQQEGDLRRRPGQGERDEADAASFLHRARPRPRRRAARHRRTSPGATRHADLRRPWRNDEIAVYPSEMAHGRMRTKKEHEHKRPAPLRSSAPWPVMPIGTARCLRRACVLERDAGRREGADLRKRPECHGADGTPGRTAGPPTASRGPARHDWRRWAPPDAGRALRPRPLSNPVDWGTVPKA